jgi:predicted ArsR family transcriptional regulator
MTDTISDQNMKTESKAKLVERLLKRHNGASLSELVEATGWQPHTCRAFLTGLRKKGRVPVRDKRKDGVTFYKLAAAKQGRTVKGAAAEPAVSA